VLTPFLRVTNSRIKNLVFRRLVLFLWFSIVFQNNYGGDSQISFLNSFSFLVRRPVAIPVTTHKSNRASTPTKVGLRLEEVADPKIYRRMVGSLWYLCNTRPDMSYSVGLISRYMQDPRVSHMNATKRILLYVQGTYNFGILLPKKKQGEG